MQLDRIKRFIKKKEKYELKSQWYDKARQQMSQSYEKARQQLQEKNNMMSQIGLSSISSGLSMLKFDVNEIDIERDIENEILKEEDKELIKAIRKQNRKTCFCFKQKVKKELQEQL